MSINLAPLNLCLMFFLSFTNFAKPVLIGYLNQQVEE